MDINQFSLYSMATENERKTSKEYDEVLQQIQAIEKCRTINGIKKYLKESLNITECVENYKLGTIGYLTTKDSDRSFKVIISYADEVHTCIFAKNNEKES